jgi:hypothetical protein
MVNRYSIFGIRYSGIGIGSDGSSLNRNSACVGHFLMRSMRPSTLDPEEHTEKRSAGRAGEHKGRERRAGVRQDSCFFLRVLGVLRGSFSDLEKTMPANGKFLDVFPWPDYTPFLGIIGLI